MFDKLKPKSEFSRNVLTLMTGTTIAQAIPIAISPILTRIYTPEDFGVFASALSIVGIFLVFSTLKYDMAIVPSSSDSDAKGLVAFSLFIAFIVSSGFFLILSLFSRKIFILLGMNALLSYWVFIPMSIFTITCHQVFISYKNRLQAYGVISQNRIYQSVVTAIAQISAGFFGFGLFGMIFGYFFGFMVALCLLLKKINIKKVYPYCRFEFLYLSKKYISFPKYALPQSIVDTLNSHGVVLLISYFYSSLEVGLFALATRVAAVPLSIVGGAVSQVFYAQASRDIDNIYFLTISTIKKLVLFSFVPYLLLFFFAEWAVLYVFGNAWIGAGEIVEVLTLWLFVRFVSSPLSTIPMIIGKQKEFLYVGVVYNFIIFGLLGLCGSMKLGFILSLKIAYVSSAIYLLLVILWLVRLVVNIKNYKMEKLNEI